MPSSPSASLRVELQETGEGLNVWGTKLNQGLVLHEQAICGVLIKPISGNVTLTTANYVSDEARNHVLVFTAGTGLSAPPTVTVPPAPKSWHVDNRTGYPITFTMGGTPVTVPVGRQADVFCDGANLFMLEPVAAASAVTQVFAEQAAASAVAAASSASTATTRRDQALAARDEAYAARDAAQAYRDTTLGYRNDAALRVGYAQEWATKAENSPVSVAAGGDGATTFSAFHWSKKAAASASSVDGPALNARLTALENAALRPFAYSLAFGG